MKQFNILADIDAALEHEPDNFPTCTLMEYSAVTPGVEEEAHAVVLGQALRYAVAETGGRATSEGWYYPNGSRIKLSGQLFEYRTGLFTDSTAVVRDEYDANGVLAALQTYKSKWPLAIIKRTGWEHNAAAPGSAAYMHITTAPARKLREAAVDEKKRNFLASWIALKSPLFGAGVVTAGNGWHNKGPAFRFSQRAAAVGAVTAANKSTTHGKKLMFWLSGGEVAPAFCFLADDAHQSRRLTGFNLAANELALRLVINDRYSSFDLPQLLQPVHALHTVSADLALQKTYETVSGKSITALDGIRMVGAAGLQLAMLEDLPVNVTRAARQLTELPDRLSSLDVRGGQLNGLETVCTWAAKYRLLLRKVGDNPSSIRGGNAEAVSADLRFDMPNGIASRWWQQFEAAA